MRHCKDLWKAGVLTLLLTVAGCGTKNNASADSEENRVFQVEQPDLETSPYTGMTRQHWIDAATYLLDGAFSYIDSLDAPMYFPKQLDKTYPNSEGQVPVAKLEGLCRTLFVAAPLLRENPDLELNGIRVADYYRHQLVSLSRPGSNNYIAPRAKDGGPSQTLVEFGALAISLTVAPEVLWDPLTQAQKDSLAHTMLSYGDGPTIDSNWRFFNIFVLSFFKDKGYTITDSRLKENIERTLAAYRGEGWYNDSPAYDYYSMWAFQMYGPLWAHYYGKFYPELARQYLKNQADLTDNYPYLFARDGRMNMWGRSICYRFAAVVPFSMLALTGNTDADYGWLRHISSATLLQFLQHPGFLEDRIPTMGFYGPFAPAVQIYSCRGSVFWCGKAFLALLLPEDHPFWTAKENEGPWAEELKPGKAYNKFQPASTLLITNYPNIGASEVRSWCHEKVANDWQKFRSTENYNKLAYNTAFPWMADGPDGEISMNYGVRNAQNQWEVMRLYDFQKFENDIYYRDAVLETNPDIRFRLADIPLADGILRVDKVTSPVATTLTLGHYSLPRLDQPIDSLSRTVNGQTAYILDNGEYQLALIAYNGWGEGTTFRPAGLHPVSEECALNTLTAPLEAGKEKTCVTLMLWKKSDAPFTDEELSPVTSAETQADGSIIVTFRSGEKKTVRF